MIVSRLFVTTLLLVAFTVPVMAQTDTLFIKYDKYPGSEVLYPFASKGDSLNAFPDSSLTIYVFEIEGKNLRFYYSSNPLDAKAQPFVYKKERIAALNQKVFYEKNWFEKHTYSEALELFSSSDNVIMLWDTTQPEGEEVYLVRVYFDFDAYE
ncbi:hypothetical protein AB9P05_23825 [Roseivirga sp. BDSF3-8]|uniref:hypothetical protein n=1 Tax=Roseivirga sp. BDSF3-8 TaxID=3241598 RepID=UPI003531CE88